MTSVLAQLRAILWKNLLIKWRHPVATTAEIVLPVFFMSILIIIKTITSVYDSPNIAYYCGNTVGGYALDNLGECQIEPDTCSEDKYYQQGFKYNDEKYYGRLGYTDTAPNYPLYTFLIGDESPMFPEPQYYPDNPSLPFSQIVERMRKNDAILAVAANKKNTNLQAETQTLINHLRTLVNTSYADSIVYFDSENSLENYITNTKYDDDNYKLGKVGMAIVLETADAVEAQWSYSIRVNYTYPYEQADDQVACLYYDCQFTYTIPSTYTHTSDLYKPQTMDYQYGYGYSGFLTLQKTVDEYIYLRSTGKNNPIYASISMMPTEDYKTDNFQYVIASTLPIFYMLSFLFPVSRMVRALVLDKEMKIKEGMKMMGLTDFAYNMSWLITLVIQMTLVSALIVAVTGSTVFQYSDKAYVFLYFIMFAISIIMFCFLLSAVFSKSKSAAMIGPLLFFATFFPYYAVQDDSYDTSTKLSACLLAPTCFALGAGVFADYEGGLVGVRAGNAGELTGNISFDMIVWMLFVDSIIYGLLAWYLDKVFPSEFGTQLPWYFPVLKSYWMGPEAPSADQLLADIENRSDSTNPNVEQVPQELRLQIPERRCVETRGLRKVFQTTDGEDRVAVKDLNMEFYEGQISVLLGHNGAGKSTTISMLTGFIPPTSGDAIMRGLSIKSDMQAIRSQLGVCPQHDILFPELTVMEHLKMYAAFKGVPPAQVNEAARQMIAEVGLVEKADVQSKMLSGGMKRKLSVGIALIGDSKIVVLDEPTSGMDPYSRRSTWNILQRNKRGRVLLLTTHFMDEADNLGDRIAIMANGELKCFGTSLFLKNRYGVGYTMTVVKRQGADHGKEISKIVKRHVPDAEPLSSVGAEQSFRLPFGASKAFVNLFTELDNRKAELNFSQYGISVTTLEEVFLRVAHNEHLDDVQRQDNREAIAKAIATQENGGSLDDMQYKAPVAEAAKDEDEDENENEDNIIQATRTYSKTGFFDAKAGREMERKVFAQHFVALLRKRFIYGLRDRKMFCCQLILPSLLVLFGLLMLQIQASFEQPSMVLSPAGSKFNPTFSKSKRNPVPFYAIGPVAEQIQAQFNNDYVSGYAIDITKEGPQPDQFDGCANGSPYLGTMANFLLSGDVDVDPEKGATRYGSVTVFENTTLDGLYYNVFVNASAPHGSGIFVNLVDSAYLQVLTGKNTAYIKVKHHPLPRTYAQNQQAATLDAFLAATYFVIAFCFIPASYAIFVVKEREVKAKHQQIISGVSIYAYWASTYAWDILSYLLPLASVTILVYAFGVEQYTSNEGAGATFMTFLLFGPSAAAFTYILTYLFKSHSTAQNMIMFLNFLLGLCLMVVSFTLTLISSTTQINFYLRYIWRLFPIFCFGDSLIQLAMCDKGRDCPAFTQDGLDYNKIVSPWAWETVTGNLVFMAIEAVVYFAVTLLIEYSMTFPKVLAWMHKTEDPGLKQEEEDDDVVAEAQRVLSGNAATDIVRLEELRKVYPTPIGPKVAVQSLSFGIPTGECFGFLGINGAGKTTTLSILSGEFPQTSGEAFIAGFNTQEDQSKIRRKIGYCPQFDALLELLTVREHLELYSRIKGVPEQYREQVVEDKLKQMDLTDFANKAAGSLSGGNKRKLSVAIAMIGEPSIIFLDEPSTGMDPMARRFMWEVIARISTHDRTSSIILTTHSMEEAEALCGRIGIMVNGKLRCLGSPQHLKAKFGAGYEVDLRTRHATVEELLDVARRLYEAGVISELPENEARLGAGRLEEPFSRAGEALGNLARIDEIAPARSGALLHDIFVADSYIPLRNFAEWWLAEDFAAAVNSFMQSTFPGVLLLERATSHAFRFRIPTADMPLPAVFDRFESAKTSVFIENYSVGQTTLEQIFNQFAASQENPEVAAR